MVRELEAEQFLMPLSHSKVISIAGGMDYATIALTITDNGILSTAWRKKAVDKLDLFYV